MVGNVEMVPAGEQPGPSRRGQAELNIYPCIICECLLGLYVQFYMECDFCKRYLLYFLFYSIRVSPSWSLFCGQWFSQSFSHCFYVSKARCFILGNNNIIVTI